MKIRHSLLSTLLSYCLLISNSTAARHGSRAHANYDESKVPTYTLPELLKAENSLAIKTPEQWKTIRRPELLRSFERNVYGIQPPKPQGMTFSVYSDKLALNGKALRKQIHIAITGQKSGPTIDLLLYIPTASKTPSPVFLGMNFAGNHTVHSDPGITVNEKGRGFARGSKASQWQVEKIINRGFALATFNYQDVAPDNENSSKSGVQALYPELQNRKDDFAAISAWAWGLSRALDYLETDKAINARQVAVMGHSRLGKAALWAGATDERFALVISNDSGHGGAAVSRRKFGETVADLNQRFPHWFCKKFKTYNNQESALPIDQHMLIALLAPRPVYIASAQNDQWADPRGEYLSASVASQVYRLFGSPGLPDGGFPDINHPLMSDIGYHVRSGKHDVTEYDWEQYLLFADRHFRAKK